MNFSSVQVMGILNTTPDSFSDGGQYTDLSKALNRAKDMLDSGIQVLDIGGESTRPGSLSLSLEEERIRVIPAVRKILNLFPKTWISVDTYKPSLAEEALFYGASMINDIRGLREPGMAQIVAKYRAWAVIMHMQGEPSTMQVQPMRGDVVSQVLEFFKEQIDFALSAGIDQNKIILDPGIGFGKTQEDNLNLIRSSKFFREKLGYPVLIGASRKSVVGHILGNSVEERKNGSVILHTLAVLSGAEWIRVHDVKETLEAVKILNAFYR